MLQNSTTILTLGLLLVAGLESPHLVLGAGGDPEVKIYFYHLDHLGTPRVITDENGQVVSTHKYLPFGEELSPVPSTNSHKFTGHERDNETGLDYMLARYYSSGGTFRFGSVDPSAMSISLLNPQSWNRYSYAANNPVRYLDPDGKHNAEGHNTITDEALKDEMSEEAVEDVKEGTLGVDDEKGSITSTKAESTNKHGMAGKKSDGTWQTPEEAAAGTAEYVGAKVQTAAEKALNGDIEGARKDMGAATHAVQDQIADSHIGGQRWEGLGTDLGRGAVHTQNDRDLTSRERSEGVRATQDVHASTVSAIQALGQAKGLSDAAISSTVKSFNGK